MYPNWMSGFEDFSSHVLRAHTNCVNGDIPHSGKDIHVGIFDSIGSVEPDIKAELAIENERPNPRAHDPGPHGYRVLSLAGQFAQGATFSVYQVFKGRDASDYDALVDMVDHAIDDGVDIVNMSLGNKEADEIAHCPVARATEPLLDNDITVVAASGNYDRDDDPERPPVATPAAMASTIAVSGIVAECPEPAYRTHDVERKGPYYLYHQPNTGVYCGYCGCTDGASCADRRTIREWTDNPRPRNGCPDVLAPPQFPTFDRRRPLLATGTSHAAPIVTGVLASIYGELRAQGRSLPTPSQARAAVRAGGVTPRSIAFPILDGDETRRFLLDEA